MLYDRADLDLVDDIASGEDGTVLEPVEDDVTILEPVEEDEQPVQENDAEPVYDTPDQPTMLEGEQPNSIHAYMYSDLLYSTLNPEITCLRERKGGHGYNVRSVANGVTASVLISQSKG